MPPCSGSNRGRRSDFAWLASTCNHPPRIEALVRALDGVIEG